MRKILDTAAQLRRVFYSFIDQFHSIYNFSVSLVLVLRVSSFLDFFLICFLSFFLSFFFSFFALFLCYFFAFFLHSFCCVLRPQTEKEAAYGNPFRIPARCFVKHCSIVSTQNEMHPRITWCWSYELCPSDSERRTTEMSAGVRLAWTAPAGHSWRLCSGCWICNLPGAIPPQLPSCHANCPLAQLSEGTWHTFGHWLCGHAERYQSFSKH